jgi:hypothetical protein
MYRIVGIDGSVYGPVTEAQVRQWISEGRANAQTQAQAENSPEWKPLSAFPEFAAALATPPLPPHLVTDVHQPASVEEVNDILKRDYTLDIGSCFSRGWEMLKADFWPFVGVTALIFVISLASGMVPYVGGCISLVVDGPLFGGLAWYYILRIRAMPASVGDSFAGFSRGFLQLFLAHLVQGLAVGVILIPGVVALALGVLFFAAMGTAAIIMLATGAFLLVVAVPIAIYLEVAWSFSPALIMDKKLPFWDAMQLSRKVVQKHWWTVFGLILLSVIVAAAGVLGCCVGIFATMPIGWAAYLFAYEHIFGSLYKKPSQTPEAAAQLPRY